MSTTVLVVDDTDGNRYAVSRLLRAASFDVLEAGTGADALASVQQHPDLVILDINLPDMSGYEVCRRIKADPTTAAIPVMHLSASYTGSADRAYGLEAGADAYLTHPLDTPVFVATVRALLRTSRAEAEVRRTAREWRTTFDAIRDAIFLIESEGTLRRCNRAAATLLGTEPAQIIGWSWDRVVAALEPGDGEVLRDLATRGPGQWETTLRGKDTRIVSHRTAEAGAERTPPEQARLTVIVFSDITDERNAQRERETLLAHTERARAEAEAARGEAEAANRAKADFLAVMSHELRTPLNAIAGFTDLISLGVRGPVTPEQQSDLAKIRRSQVTLMTHINDLLSFAKLESGSVHFENVDVVVDDALAVAAELVESQARAKGVALECQRNDPSLVAYADADKVQQILLNLLTNAIKFTSAGGVITVGSAPAKGEWAMLFVRDTGRGIPSDKHEAIFDPFMQVDQRLARQTQGVGLGLAISRDLARAMNGDLTVESVEGEGSMFTLRLPRSTTPTPTPSI